MKLDRIEEFKKELLIDFGGILVNTILLIFLKGELLFINLIVLVFNIIPMIPLDGSKILKVILARFIPYYNTLYISNIISLITLSILSLLSMMFLDYLILFNLTYLWIILVSSFQNIKIEYESFLLNRYLDNYLYSSKYVKFNHDLINKLYYYSNIYTYFNNKRRTEREILEYHYRNNSVKIDFENKTGII